jgi:transcriptional regulator with XRE-family HTH domain
MDAMSKLNNVRRNGIAASVVSEARRRSGLTQRALAVRAGTSPSAIAARELGQRDPTVSSLARIIAACGLDLRVEIRGTGGTGNKESGDG